MVKHSWLAKNHENRENFPPRMFYRIQYGLFIMDMQNARDCHDAWS